MKILNAALLFSVLSASLAACTTNVENPQVDQTGRTGDVTCVMGCDDANTTCVAKCTDDACKATCTTNLDQCKTTCTTTDGG